MPMVSQAMANLNRLLRKVGVQIARDRPMRDAVRLFDLKCRERGVATVLDIGANVGQFGEEFLHGGWRGQLVSFEPLAHEHAALVQRAGDWHGRWQVAPAMALGAANDTTEILVSDNSVSSSLLPVNSASTDVIAATRQSTRQQIDLRRLDDVMQPEWNGPFALKLDTQGYELAALQGSENVLQQTQVIMTEMSLVSLYEGGARIGDLFNFLDDRGFRCIALTEGFAHYDRNEVLQVDGVFIKEIAP